jgi:membrane-bound metal-dependent hydrolase YbcI (DUF457 family)
MPSPIGHTLAGLAVGWLSEPAPAGQHVSRVRSALTPAALWCAFVAAIPDADLLIPHLHRSASHSVTATALVLIMAIAVTGKVTRRATWTFALAVAAAHGTHLVLDWLGTDRFPPPGIQLFWPFSDRFYISGLDLFPPVERRLLRPEAFGVNLRAATWELLIIGPVAAVAWMIRNQRRKINVTMARREAESR